jgi:hypothetical protein
MRRLSQLMRTPLFSLLAISIAFCIRAFASFGRPIARFPDSLGYDTFQLFGSIDRFWPIPFIYSLVQSDTSRVALHVIVGGIAWAWCALLLSRISKYPRIVLSSVLLLGLSPQVVRYDLAILSESLGISFMVLAVASSLHLQQRRTTSSVVLWLLSVSLCAHTRPAQLLILFVVLVPPTYKFLQSKGRQISATTFALLLVLLAGFLQLTENSNTSALNFYTVLQERVLTNDVRFQWFSNHGMPVTEEMREALGYDYAANFPKDISDIIALPVGQQPPALMRAGGPELARWIRDDGWTTYAKYIATHPSDSLSRLTSLTNKTLSPPNDDFLPLDNGPMIPRVLFGSWELWSAMGLVATAIIFLKNRREFTMVGGFVLATVSVYALSMLTSGIEHPRHAVTSAVAMRLIPLVAVVLALPRTKPKAELDESVDERS